MSGPRRVRSSRRRSSAPRGTPRERALGLLAVRWRSREELRRRLVQAGFEGEDIEEALIGLEEAGLVDDGRFAAELVRDQAGRRLAGDRAISSALRQKGVPQDVAEQALEQLGGEAERARELARARAGRMAGLSPDAAFRRLFGLLQRRGYGPGVAREACRNALAEVFSPDDIGSEED